MSKSSDLSLEIDKDIQYVIKKKHTISSEKLQTQNLKIINGVHVLKKII